MIIGISGLAGSGKDTAADYLARECGFVKLAFADPLKRIAREVFEFTDEQLWGPSEKRNAPDPRYRRERRVLVDQDEYENRLDEGLTPRECLQKLGTEWGRSCYPSIWVDLGLRLAKKLDGVEGVSYDAQNGTFRCARPRIAGVVIPDCRFANELNAVHAAGGKTIRITRPGSGLGGAAALHVSEREMAELPSFMFDEVIENVGTLAAFRVKVLEVLAKLR